MSAVIVIPTGAANIASVLAGLRRAGGDPRVARGPEELDGAARVVLPGVGTFGAAMAALRSAGYVQPLVARIAHDRPTLAVCVGLQVLCASSDESPGAAGLGVLPQHVERFPLELRVPQFGWNRVSGDEGGAVEPGYAYFANSYCLRAAPDGWAAAWADYGRPFVAALARGALLGCQFHPELSGVWGNALLGRWLAQEPAAC